ncbi:MAG: hypothetical protein RLZZ15_3890 [Verrucomicrobiota bacterium]|jgi:hypothetical protein
MASAARKRALSAETDAAVRALAVKREARALMAAKVAQGRTYEALADSVGLLGIDLTKGPIRRRQLTYCGVRLG